MIILSKENREMRAARQWTKMKSMGEKKFIWFNGIVKYGLPMGIIFPIILQLLDIRFSPYGYSNKKIIISLIISIPVF